MTFIYDAIRDSAVTKIEKPGLNKKNKSRQKSQAEKDHLSWVASNPCCICGRSEVQLHHIRILGEPRDHKKVIPLCYDHHQGKEGLHTLGKHVWRKRFGYELDMLKTLLSRKL